MSSVTRPARKYPPAQPACRVPLIAGVIVLLLAGGAFAAWKYWPREDPQVAKVKEISAKLFTPPAEEKSNPAAAPSSVSAGPEKASEESRPATEEERSSLFQQLRQEMEKLSETQMAAVRENMREMFQARMKEKIAQYKATPEAQKKAFLDKEIDQWEQRREQFRSERERQEAQQASSGGNAAAPENAPPRGDGPGGFRNASPEQREEFQKRMVDNTTPQERADFAQYMTDMNERRKERGLEVFGPFGR